MLRLQDNIFGKLLEKPNVVPYLKVENVNMYMPFIVKVISDVNIMFLRGFQTKPILSFSLELDLTKNTNI